MKTKFSERLERAAAGGVEELLREAVRCGEEAVRAELGAPLAARLRFEEAVLLDESPNPDLIQAAVN